MQNYIFNTSLKFLRNAPITALTAVDLPDEVANHFLVVTTSEKPRSMANIAR
jgi:branched-subunit amino acid transport protein